MGRATDTRQWAMRLTGRPPRRPLVVLGSQALGWGALTSALAGTAAGTAILPLWGTVFGAAVGLYVGIGPTLLGTVLVVVIGRRHRPLTDPLGFHRDLRRLFGFIRGLLMLVGIVIVAVIAGVATSDGELLPGVGAALWLGVGPYVAASLVVTYMLRRAAERMMLTFAERSGWDVVDARYVAGRGSPEGGDSQVGGPLGRVFPEGAS